MDDYYKDDEDSLIPTELIKDKRANLLLDTRDKSKSNKKQFSLNHFISQVSDFLNFFSEITTDTTPDNTRSELLQFSFQILKQLRYYSPFSNPDITPFILTNREDQDQSFAQFLMNIISATTKEDKYITFKNKEQRDEIQDCIFALLANFSFQNHELAKSFFELKVLNIMQEDIDKYEKPAVLNCLRFQIALLCTSDLNTMFGQVPEICNFIEIFHYFILEQKDIEIREYALAVITELMNYSKILSNEIIEACLEIVHIAFDNEYMELRRLITNFLVNIGNNWDNCFPQCYDIFPIVISQGIANKEDSDLIYYSLLLAYITFSHLRKAKDYDVAELLLKISINSIVEFVKYPSSNVQFSALSVIAACCIKFDSTPAETAENLSPINQKMIQTIINQLKKTN